MKALLVFLSLVLVVATRCPTANSSRASSKCIVLVAGMEAPANGVASTIDGADLQMNLDPKAKN